MSRLFRVLLVFLTVTLAACAGVAEQPPTPQSVRVIVFPGGFNWPVWVAQDKGMFERNGVRIEVTPTPNSTFQLTGLIEGKFDIAMTAIDNLIAYREGQGEAPVTGSDLIAVMGGDQGFLRLVTVPEVKSFDQLRGRTLSVDARTTGYAFVLLELLDRNGLREPAYSLERAGGVMQRYQALLEKKHAGTLLISPFDIQANAKGFNTLASATAVLGPYQGLVAGVRREWAQRNGAALTGYIKSYAQAVEWLYDPANKAEAIAILRKHLPNADERAAETAHRVLLDRNEGFQRDARIDLAGVRTVLALRSKWSEAKRTLGDPSRYYDPTWYDAALRR